MSLRFSQYADPFIYNLGAGAIPKLSDPAKTLRELIATIASSALPPPEAAVLAFELIPLATTRMYGGYKPRYGNDAAGFRPAAEGGGYLVISTTGNGFDLSDPLDYVKFRADIDTATTGTIVLYTAGQAGK